jgi:DNA polymerase-3 subunit alpha
MGLGIPLGRRNKEAEVHCEHDMNGAEEVGLLKLDVLGLRTMTVIGEVEDLIGDGFNIKDVPLDDEDTFKLLGGGPDELKGVFQLSKDAIGNAMRSIRPSEFEDIIAILALFRPGPMEQIGSYAARKLGREDVEVAHPDLGPILAKTYGLIVYQEQVMAIATVLGGYTPGEGDMFRKAIGKKLPKLIATENAKFKAKALERGYEEEFLDALCLQIADFGRYGFNRGHATGYGFITYWTAFLKCHYPVEFYTAVLNSHVGDADKIIQFSRDLAARGIKLLTPDINTSGLKFQAESGGIRFGFEGVKGLGTAAARDIYEYRSSDVCLLHTRETVDREKIVDDVVKKYRASIKISKEGPNPDKRPYDGFEDFCFRHPGITITAKRALIAAGAFDGGDLQQRAELYAMAEDINVQSKKKRPKEVELDEDEPVMEEMEMLAKECEVLGSFVTKHPLEPHRNILRWWGIGYGGLFSEVKVGRHLRMAGIVTNIRDHTDKSGGKMAWITMESDWSGSPEVMVFASIWKNVSIAEGDLVIVEAQKTSHAKFGTGLQAESVVAVDPNRMRAAEILLRVGDVDLLDALLIKERTSKRGAKLTILAEVDGGRLALIRTKSFIRVTVQTLTELEEAGYDISLNPGKKITEFLGVRIERAQSTLKGRGTERHGIWELPDVKLWLTHLGGKVIAEYKPIE